MCFPTAQGLRLLSPPSPSPPRKRPILQDMNQVPPPLFRAFPSLQAEGAVLQPCPTASPSTITAYYMAFTCSFICLYTLTPEDRAYTLYLIHFRSLTALSTETNSKNLGTSLGEGNGTPLQYSCLENPMDGGAW